jgi:hypothetical protein
MGSLSKEMPTCPPNPEGSGSVPATVHGTCTDPSRHSFRCTFPLCFSYVVSIYRQWYTRSPGRQTSRSRSRPRSARPRDGIADPALHRSRTVRLSILLHSISPSLASRFTPAPTAHPRRLPHPPATCVPARARPRQRVQLTPLPRAGPPLALHRPP